MTEETDDVTEPEFTPTEEYVVVPVVVEPYGSGETL